MKSPPKSESEGETEESVEAFVGRWRYEPALEQGQPVPAILSLNLVNYGTCDGVSIDTHAGRRTGSRGSRLEEDDERDEVQAEPHP
jgi:hypothetical protein